MSQYPKFFARFYDLIYENIRSDVDEEFFLNKIKDVNGSILEIGTGTGRFFTRALESGKNIYGIDISSEMISILLKRISVKDHYRISKQGITDFEFSRKFDLIIAPFRVFMHLLEVDEQLAALDNVFNHLADKGKFIFDLYVPDLNILLNGLNDVVDFEGEYQPGKKIKRITSAKNDLINQVNNVTMKFEWQEEDGINREEEWAFQMRYFFRFELEHLLKRSLFNKYAIYGDYELNDLDEKSRDFVVLCEK